MDDFVYLPSHVLPLLFDGVVTWESVESLMTLLSICDVRAPVDYEDGFTRYAIDLKDVDARFRESSDFQEFTFTLKGERVRYIDRYKSTNHGGSRKVISFYVHDLCHPKSYRDQHKVFEKHGSQPVKLWKMPRHVLIRWRYSVRLPVHKSNFSKAKETLFPDFQEFYDLPEELIRKEFDKFSKQFFHVMCACDESSLAYGFLCYFYFYLHDQLFWNLQQQRFPKEFVELLLKSAYVFREAVTSDMHPLSKPFHLEGKIRWLLPKGYYNAYPFSNYTPVRACKVDMD